MNFEENGSLADVRGPAALKRVLSLYHLFVSLGLYTLTPVLALLITRQLPGASPKVVGLGLFAYTASAGLSALVIMRWLSRLPYVPALVCSALLTATGFGLLPYFHTPTVLMVLLVAAGVGASSHSVLGRVLVADVITDDIGRHKFYSLLMIVINFAAAVGPFLAGLLYLGTDARWLLATVSLCYVCAAAALAVGAPRLPAPTPTPTAWPVSLAMLRQVLRDRAMSRLVVVSATATFLFAQFPSAFALFVAFEFEDSAAGLRAALMAAPAVGIVVFQGLVTVAVTAAMKRGVRPVSLLAVSALVFGAGFLLLGVNLPLLAGAVLAVVFYSFAEMVFHPMINTAFAALPVDSRLEAFNLRQICWSVGEALGMLCGGSLYLLLHQRGDGRTYWLTLAALTFVGITALMLPLLGRGPVRPVAASSKESRSCAE
ncbi:MFS transporter [Streptomyces atriruber]|uniref:MFS transporter n=1 Tax=Streptomyces atriruber TaxID=545121 RepID=UPI0006E26070|nr:MFS transporter [Streptomyces atriruber]